MLKLRTLLAAAAFTGVAFASGFAFAAPYTAVFWDENIKPNWSDNHAEILKYFDGEGYEVLDSASLAEFMAKRVQDKKPSVIVFALDRVPIGVAPKASKKTPLREYLDAGGKIVWLCDIPLYAAQNPETGDVTMFNDMGAGSILSVGQTGIKYDTAGDDVTITPEGLKWGMNETWASQRAIKISKVAEATTKALAVTEDGRAAAWVRNYGGPDGTGFVRLWDRGGSPSDFSWVKAVAEYGFK